MNRLFLYFGLVVLLANWSCTGEKPRDVKQYSIEQFYKNVSIGGGSFSADESKLLVSTNETGIYNVMALPVDGSAPVALSHSTDNSVFGISFFPEDDRVLYSSDGGGNEISHIYLLDTDGSTRDLTPWEGIKSDFVAWSYDKQSFFFQSNRRDKRFFDLYEMTLSDFSEKMIFQNDEGYEIGAISKSKQFVALVRSVTTNNSEMYLHDVASGETRHISAHEGDAVYNPQYFDLSNQNLYYLTNEGDEFTCLMKYNLESGEKSKVWGTSWDVQYAYESYNETYRVIGVNEDARTKVYMFRLADNSAVDLPDFGGGDVVSVSISKSETKMRVRVASSRSVGDIFVYNLENKEVKQLTNTLNPEIDVNDLVEAEVVRYPSFDGLQIPAILYKPHQAGKKNKVPALVWVHGGPGGQSRVSYFSLIQYLVNHGYAVIAVNNRGSSGYGKTFYKLDDRRHGEDDLQDCIYAKNYLATLGWVNTEKIGIIGGSYGGYMTMAALTFTPDEFNVGVNIFGVTNWLRTLKSIPPYWESFRKALYEELGDPFTADSVRLYNISPLFHAKNVSKPLMVLQGANDPRVLQAESDEIVAAVKANQVPVEYVLFPDEGHGFLKKENEIKGYGQVLTFLDTYLK